MSPFNSRLIVSFIVFNPIPDPPLLFVIPSSKITSGENFSKSTPSPLSENLLLTDYAPLQNQYEF